MWQLGTQCSVGGAAHATAALQSAICAAAFYASLLPFLLLRLTPRALSFHICWQHVAYRHLPAIVQRLAGERLLCAQLLLVVVYVLFIEHLCDRERSNSGR